MTETSVESSSVSKKIIEAATISNTENGRTLPASTTLKQQELQLRIEMNNRRRDSKDHRQTLTSPTSPEEKFSSRKFNTTNNEWIPRQRDLLHTQNSKSLSDRKQQRFMSTAKDRTNGISSMQYILLSQSFPSPSRSIHQNDSSEDVFCVGDNEPKFGRMSSSAGRRKSYADSRTTTATGGIALKKPPLKPRRSSRHNKSVSTRSTSSATYVSSDSSDGGGRKEDDYDDDDSIEAPDIRIRIYDGSRYNDDTHSSVSSLAQYDSATDNVDRFAIVPYPDKKKKQKKRNARTTALSTSFSSKKPLQILAFSSDDEDDPFFQLDDDECHLSSSDTESDNESIVDLDKMIAETSARWKNSVGAIVGSTVTAATFNSNVNNGLIASQPSNNTVKPAHLAAVVPPSALVVASCTTHIPPSTGVTITTKKNNLIEQQQAEIEALRAALKTQLHQKEPSSKSNNPLLYQLSLAKNSNNSNHGLLDPVTSSTNPVDKLPRAEPEQDDSITVDCAPVEHIEVNHDESDPNSSQYWQDDLTVWSGFNTVSGGIDAVYQHGHHKTETNVDKSKKSTRTIAPSDAPGKNSKSKSEITKRPDAESTTGATALHGIPTRVVKDMKIELSSGIKSNVIRKALYSGTINVHTRLPEGQGVFQFIETGDIYKGEISAGEMHGAGTYIFAQSSNNNKKNSLSSSTSKNPPSRRPKELKGTFEHNVFIG